MIDGASHAGDGSPERLEVLRSVPLLAPLDDAALEQLAARVELVHLRGGERLLAAGEPSDALYVVASGRLAVISRAGHLVREVPRGEALGELGVIAGATRSADVQALRASSVWRVPADAFWDLLADHPEIQRQLLRSLADLLRRAPSAPVDHRARVVAVVGATGRSPARATARALSEALGRFGSVALLEPTPADEACDTETLVREKAQGLDHAERDNDWVLVPAQRPITEEGGWRSFALGQADRIVCVARSEAPPPWLTRVGRPVDLVLGGHVDHERWWDAVDPASHLYLEGHPTPSALEPLARRLAGRSVGVVLAGGGARGLAHFGVYAELHAAGVAVGRVGGTSAGAIAAGVMALGLDPDAAIEGARHHMVERRPLTNYTLPAVSLLRGDRLERVGRSFFGDRHIEQLPIPFYAVSADLVSGSQVVHRRGELWHAIRASISIPGLMRPVPDGERLLVDGGLLNNLPVDVMAGLDEGPIVCVDLQRTYRPSRGFGPLPVSPPAFLRRLIVGTEDPLPGIQDILTRTVDLAASRSAPEAERGVRAVVRPDVSGIGLLDWRRIDEAVEAGRVAARAVLEEHPDLAG